MAFPFTPLPVTIDLFYDGAWNDITQYVYSRGGGGIRISRGFPDEGTEPEPGEMTFQLNNRDGRFSPKNPASPLYGKIGRNTPIRVAVGLTADTFGRTETDGWGSSSDGYAWSVNSTGTGTDADFTVSPSAASVEIGGTAELRQGRLTGGPDIADCEARVTIDTSLSGPPTGGTALAGIVLRSASTTSCYWFAAVLNTDGTVGVLITAVGESGPTFASLSAVDGLTYTGQTLRMAASAKGSTFNVKVWDASGDEPVDWQLTGTDTRITAAGDVGLRCSVGSGNTDVPITYSFSDFEVISRRFVGEVSEWPVRWDVSGRDVWVDATAQGKLRQLGQGNPPVRSPLTAALLGYHQFASPGGFANRLVGYWSMEAQSATFNSLVGGSALARTGTRPDTGEDGIGPLLGSDRIPVLAADTRLSGDPRPYTPAGSLRWSVMCVMDVPVTPGWADNTPILHIHQADTGGTTVETWELRYRSSGNDLEFRALDATGAELDTTGALGFNIAGQQIALMIDMVVSVGLASFTVRTFFVDADGNLDSASASDFFALTPTAATRIDIAPAGGLADLAIGQVAVDQFAALHLQGSITDAFVSFAGETAADRAERLATDANIPFRLIGDPADTERMGPQAIPATFTEAYSETHEADLALAYESREELSLTWRGRITLYSQDPVLTLDYSQPGEVAPGLEPVDDDQNVRNDATVKRKGGALARAVRETGPNNAQSPLHDPQGVGRYDDEIELNHFDDSRLADFANWLVNVGTVDESRYPAICVNMAALAQAGKTTLMAAAAAADVGDRVKVANPPEWLPPDDIDVLALGFEEEIVHPIGWTIDFTGPPYAPYDVGTYQDTDASGDVHRHDGNSSTTSADFDTEQSLPASLSVATSAGSLWTTRASEFPLVAKIRGRLATVTNISGTSSPQTFTISAIDPVGGTIPSGSKVNVARPAFYPL